MKYNKAITFSFDDGHTQDIRLVELLNKYGVKSTFNLNSGTMTRLCSWRWNGMEFFKLEPECMPELYKGHEIASHGLCHGELMRMSDDALDYEIKKDIENLNQIFNQEIKGFVYACGRYDERALKILDESGIKYARTTKNTNDVLPHTGNMLECPSSFSLPSAFENEMLYEKTQEFLNYDGDEIRILSLWGHGYAFEGTNTWDKLEEYLKMIAFKNDILYGTNTEVYEYFKLI